MASRDAVLMSKTMRALGLRTERLGSTAGGCCLEGRRLVVRHVERYDGSSVDPRRAIGLNARGRAPAEERHLAGRHVVPIDGATVDPRRANGVYAQGQRKEEETISRPS